jgi:hypothetical protein
MRMYKTYDNQTLRGYWPVGTGFYVEVEGDNVSAEWVLQHGGAVAVEHVLGFTWNRTESPRKLLEVRVADPPEGKRCGS